ncbi:MAG: 50S ribosomal protein L4 [Erysipelothrix sp.]|nr:50S ribosomal protein L4 [Erysipelothrix sp.]
MANLKMFNLDGKELENIEVSADVFGITPNKQVLFDAVVAQQAAQRQGTHKVKNRSEVRGGGRKPWRQKGTGRARQGSIRSPQWVGGGVVFGPTTARNYKLHTNRKVRRLAIRSALSDKVLNNKAMLVENLEMQEIKTKRFIEVLNNLNVTNKTLFVIRADEDYENAYLSMKNLKGVVLLPVESLNVFDILNAENLVMTQKAAELAGEVLV